MQNTETYQLIGLAQAKGIKAISNGKLYDLKAVAKYDYLLNISISINSEF